MVVQPDGSTNAARALRLEPAGQARLPVAAVLPAATPAAAPELGIAKLAITGGRPSFIDRSVQPNAALVLSDLEGAKLWACPAAPTPPPRWTSGARPAAWRAHHRITGHAMPREDLDTRQ
ncbi:MAG: hypothetical protein IPO28_15245 [Holophagaceae bacterium]|nr:hypothetical protein [Holophagaceae bacterium]